jgi:hypothetical protein
MATDQAIAHYPHKMTVRAQLVGVCALVSIGGLQGCCWDKKDTVAEVDEPIQAEWIDERTWVLSGGGRTLIPFYPSYSTYVRIHTNPEATFSPGCHEPDPELVSDSTGARLAFRCITSRPWRLVQTIAQLVKYRGSLRRAFEELHARAGDEALARVLVSSAEWHGVDSPSGDTPDPWHTSFQKLPEQQQQVVKQGLLGRLSEEHLNPRVLETAASVVSSRDRGAVDALVLGASTVLEGPISETVHVALTWALWRLVDTGDARVGVLGCRAFDHWKSDDMVLLTIARYGTRCDAAADHAADSACWAMADCGGESKFELCSQEDLLLEVGHIRYFRLCRQANSGVQ